MTTAQQMLFKKISETDAKVEKVIGILTGGNGGGLSQDIKNNDMAIEFIKKELPELVHKKECLIIRDGIKSIGRKNWITVKDIIFMLVMAITLLFGNGIIRNLQLQQIEKTQNKMEIIP